MTILFSKLRGVAFLAGLLRSAMAWSAAVSGAAVMTAADVVWEELPPLPPSAGQTVQPGVAGPFVGVHGNALIVAGGANFPQAMPWDGGAKVWWDDIWVLEKTAEGKTRWVGDKTFRLPRRLGYGVSVSVPEGVICVGGHDAERVYAEVFLLSWDAKAREIRRVELPSMPEPLTFMAGAMVGRTLYVAGGQHTMRDARPTSVFWSLDLSKRDRPAEFGWKVLPPWPGPARVLAVAAAQRTSTGDALFLFSGRGPRAGQPTELFTDAYAFDPVGGKWRTLSPVGGGPGVSVMAAAAMPWGNDRVVVFGGDGGDVFLELERHDLAIAALRAKLKTADATATGVIEAEIAERFQAKRAIYARHPGFAREVRVYDARQNTWSVLTRAPFGLPVTTGAVEWDGAIVIPSGEVRPGVRTPTMLRVQLTE